MYQIRKANGRRTVEASYVKALGVAIKAGPGSAIYTQGNHCLTRIG